MDVPSSEDTCRYPQDAASQSLPKNCSGERALLGADCSISFTAVKCECCSKLLLSLTTHCKRKNPRFCTVAVSLLPRLSPPPLIYQEGKMCAVRFPAPTTDSRLGCWKNAHAPAWVFSLRHREKNNQSMISPMTDPYETKIKEHQNVWFMKASSFNLPLNGNALTWLVPESAMPTVRTNLNVSDFWTDGFEWVLLLIPLLSHALHSGHIRRSASKKKW